MFKTHLPPVVAAATFLLPLAAQAQTVYTDGASAPAYTLYSPYSGLNGGSGYGPFTVSSAGGSSGFGGAFIGSSTTSESGTHSLDTNGQAFGFYAKLDPAASVTISRAFTTGLQHTNDSFSMDFMTGYNDNGTAGVALLSGGAPVGSFVYDHSAGGFTYNGAVTGQGYQDGVLHLTWTVTAPGVYAFTASGPLTYAGVGTFSGTLSGFQVVSTDSSTTLNYNDHNGYFNNLRETIQPTAAPEPGSAASVAVGGLILGGAVVRRRRELPA